VALIMSSPNVPNGSSSSEKNDAYDLITLGETMWRLSPPGNTRLEAAHQLDIKLGGAEGNVAVGLARLGKRTAWWSRLPDNAPGHHVANTLRSFGVDVSGVAWGGSRLGTYFVEFGSPPRPTQVIYDRANSAASEMTPADFDWSLLSKTRWLHLTGITPALSASCLETVRHAVKMAHDVGTPISLDLNYRTKLWTMDEARPIFDELASQCTLVIAAARDGKALIGGDTPPNWVGRGLHRRWHTPTVIVTMGERGASAFDGHDSYEAPAYPVTIVDKIGAGDAFDVGLLCALMDGKSLEDALRYGNAVAALKMTMPGDLALVTHDEVERLMSQPTEGIVR